MSPDESANQKKNSGDLLNAQVAVSRDWLLRLASFYRKRGHENKAQEILDSLSDRRWRDGDTQDAS